MDTGSDGKSHKGTLSDLIQFKKRSKHLMYSRELCRAVWYPAPNNLMPHVSKTAHCWALDPSVPSTVVSLPKQHGGLKAPSWSWRKVNLGQVDSTAMSPRIDKDHTNSLTHHKLRKAGRTGCSIAWEVVWNLKTRMSALNARRNFASIGCTEVLGTTYQEWVQTAAPPPAQPGWCASGSSVQQCLPGQPGHTYTSMGCGT